MVMLIKDDDEDGHGDDGATKQVKCLADSGANKTDKVKEIDAISFISRPGFLRFRTRIMAFIYIIYHLFTTMASR